MSPTNRGPHRCGVILAGGDGSRLRPFIRNLLGTNMPKQYAGVMGTQSMLEHAIGRAERLITPECLFTVIAKDHLKFPEVHRQLEDRPPHRVVVQPMNRETGPGLLLPLVHLFLRYPNSSVAVFPSDHFILQEARFAEYVRQAFEHVEKYPSKIVFLGAKPAHVESGYGFVLPESPDSKSSFMRVKAFVEKPSLRIATQVTGLGALWNTMAMVFRPEVLFQLVGLSSPKLHRCFQRIFRSLNTPRERRAIEQIYQSMPTVNFSEELLGALDIHSRNQFCVLPMEDIFWSDWDSEGQIHWTLDRLSSMSCLPEEFQLDEIASPLPAMLRTAS